MARRRRKTFEHQLGLSFEQISETTTNGVEEFFRLNGFDEETIAKLDHATFTSRVARPGFSVVNNAHRKERTIDMPNHLMRAIHRWLIHEKLGNLDGISEYACGIRGKQLDAMVTPHLGNEYFFKLDLKSAYASVNIDRLATILEILEGTPMETWRAVIEKFCISPLEGGLATGGNASPLLFNLYISPLDEALGRYAEKQGLVFTRYMDDMVFSSPDSPIGRHRSRAIKQRIYEYGFEINDRKVRYTSLDEGPFMITGLQINPSGKWQISHRNLRNIIRYFDETYAQLRVSDLDYEEIGSIRGVHGYLKACASKERGLSAEEQRAFSTYHEIERLYRHRHPG